MTQHVHDLTLKQIEAYHEDREYLSEIHIAVLDARITLGLSYGQIAGVLGLPMGTVRSRIHRGFAALNELGTFKETVHG
jgi:DNA-directed RNA polymerase specialized sigma24 family protein